MGPRRDEVLAALGEVAPVRVVGITGPPGAGKSTTVGALVGAYRANGLRVAVLAVDPSSPSAVVRCSETGFGWPPTSTIPTS